MKRQFSLPPGLEDKITAVLKKRWNIDLANAADLRSLAKDVLRMSDFYIADPLAKTPWSESWCQRAQLVYFLPLNATRMSAVLTEAQTLGFFEGLKSSLDFGAGLGASHFAMSSLPGLKLREREVELSNDAKSLRSELGEKPHFANDVRDEAQLLVCSYSLTEFQKTPDLFGAQSDLILLEPGTREDGRKLLELREKLKTMGYSIWAPCTHQGHCPLLVESQTDWCHDRIHFEAPSWFLEIEKHLPIKNPTLSFSYLIASKRPSPVPPDRFARLIGDQLHEKGKTRQLFCRGERREYLSWLERYGEAPKWPRGLTVPIPSGELKGNELRVKP